MGSKGEITREKILSVAESIILQKGFSATSIEEIIQQSNITKGGFFYHFSGKNDLASSLVQRYLVQDDLFFNSLFERADSLSEDPLQQMLIFMKLLSEAMADLPNGHPGCLVASFAYESMQFEKEVLDLTAEGIISWRNLFLGRLENITSQYPMNIEVSLTELADMLTAVVEGGIVMSLVTKDPNVLVQQILQYRIYLRLLFEAPTVSQIH